MAILYKRNAQPDEHFLGLLENRLRDEGFEVFVDRHMAIGVEWAMEIERRVRSAAAVIPLLSAASVQSEMLAYELQTAHDASQHQEGRPRILPVRVAFDGPLPPEMAAILDPLQYVIWQQPVEDARLALEILHALRHPSATGSADPEKIEPVGGAVPLDSRFYHRAANGSGIRHGDLPIRQYRAGQGRAADG